MNLATTRRGWAWMILLGLAIGSGVPASRGGEPDPATYWDVEAIRPGMKGVGRTVMVGTTLEEFSVEVLGVMRDVSPGRDMILCRLSGCNLEHAGIIQGMSGSPIYIEGKLVGAVAFAWEFAKDPIAGVTPFAQMVKYVRANDRRIAAERQNRPEVAVSTTWAEALGNRDSELPPVSEAAEGPVSVSGGGLAGMRPIATPMAATGFSPRALEVLSERLGPLGLAPMAGGGASKEVIEREGEKPLEPGSPVSVAMVTGDFDLSGIGTVTHVEGDRVYAFGHPMMGLGACELPMMTGYIHTVYPRSSVSMKLGSPLKVVGVLDTDVSTAVSGRLGAKPDMLPVSVSVRNGEYAEAHVYHVEIAREPHMMATLLLSTLTNAIDTEGNLPSRLTARIAVDLEIQGHEPILLKETLSGSRYSGPMGASALFGPIASTVSLLVRNPLEPVRIESIDCRVEIEPGEQVASVESVRLESDRVEPGQTLRALVTLKPNLGERRTVELSLPIPKDFPEGEHEVAILDVGKSLVRRFRNDPSLTSPRDLTGLLRLIRERSEPTRTAVYLHVQRPGQGVAVEGQPLPNLPGSVRAAFGSRRSTSKPTVREDLTTSEETPWVIEANETLKFRVVRETGVVETAAK